MEAVEVKIVNQAILEYGIPTQETAGAAGYDLRACIEEPILIPVDSSVKIPTGIAVHIKSKNYAGFVMPRSGLAAKFSITLQNAVGLIDSDFQGELQVLMRNEGREVYRVNPGDRIGQLVFVPVVTPIMLVVTEFSVSTDRGEKGFGSTGVASRSLNTPLAEDVATAPGGEYPTQALGNSRPIEVGAIQPNTVTYEPTGQELLEAEYGD